MAMDGPPVPVDVSQSAGMTTMQDRGMSDEMEETLPPVEVPYTELSGEALRGVIENFVLREGTEYGLSDFSLDEKVVHVMRQLERKEAWIMFDPNTESVTLVRSGDRPRG